MKKKYMRWIISCPISLLAAVLIYGHSQESMPSTITFQGQECPVSYQEDGSIMIDTSQVTASRMNVVTDAQGRRMIHCGRMPNFTESVSSKFPIYTEK